MANGVRSGTGRILEQIIAGRADSYDWCRCIDYKDRYGSWYRVHVTAQIEVTLLETEGFLHPVDDLIVTNEEVCCRFTDGYCFDMNQGKVIWDSLPGNDCNRKGIVCYMRGMEQK
jgi:hypothetical protein